MSNKVSDCCGYESAESDLHGVYCLKCGKPCGVKSEPDRRCPECGEGISAHGMDATCPVPAPDRLLSDGEINEVTIWCNHPVEIPKAIANAQDAKTASLKDKEIKELKAKVENLVADLDDAKTCHLMTVDKLQATHNTEMERVFQDLENYQVSVRNGSKIIYGSNFQAVKDKYLPTSQTGDKKLSRT